MATNIIKIIDSQDKVVSQTQVASGKSITVSAKEGQSYEFISGATKRAPDEIKTTREGNNLKVEIKDGDATSTTIIEDYYTNGEGDLVGLAEDGHFYNFVPEEMGNDYMVTDLADGVSSFQALGSEGDSMSPWWLGLPLLALGAAGGGGGSGAANTLPDAPNLLMVSDDTDNALAATGSSWGADDDRGSWSFDSATGEWSVSSGNVNLVDGKIITNDSTPTLSGTGEAGTTVRVYDGAVDPDNLVAETIVDSDGNWEITTDSYIRALQETPLYLNNGDENSPLQNNEHTLNITLANGTGNESNPTSIDMIVDTIGFYDMAHITFNKDQADERSDVGGEVTGTDSHYYSGSLTISDDLIMEAGVQEKEIVSYQVDDEIYVTLINQETGDEYRIAERNSPGVDDAPTGYSTIVTDSSVGWSVTVDFTQEYYNATTGTWETLPDGNYASKVLVHEISGDIYVHSSSNQIDNNGTDDPSDDTSYGIFGIDRVAPDASQVVSQTLTNNHTITINVVDSAPMFFAAGDTSDGLHSDSDYLVGTGVNELFIYRDGVEVGTKNITGEISLTNWTDDTSLADGVYMYQIDSVDVAGNHSGLGEKSWVLFDSDLSHDLTSVDDNLAKCFDEMVLVGNSSSETFTLDNVGFASIDAAGGITDTFTLTGSGQTLDIAKTTNFEVYKMGDNTLDIGSSVVDGDTDHVTINGTSSTQVNLDDSVWAVDPSATVSGYIVYNNTNGGDSLYIQDGVSVVI